MDDQLMPYADPIDHLLQRLQVNSVFGTPTAVGDVTIIPVAEISTRFGYGFGSGTSSMQGGREGREPVGGTGGGGGAGGSARPVGYIRVAPDGVQFEPMLDLPRTSIAGIALVAWIVFWVARTIQSLRRNQ